MNISVVSKDVFTLKSELLVIPVFEGKAEKSALLKKIDQKLSGELFKILKREKIAGKAGQNRLLPTYGKLKASFVMVVGLGASKKFDTETLRKAGGVVGKTASQVRASSVTLVAGQEGEELSQRQAAVGSFVEGFSLSSYQFNKYRKPETDAHRVAELVIVCLNPREIRESQAAAQRALSLSQGVSLARDLINTPARDMTPLLLAQAAKGLKGVTTKVMLEPQIRKLKMGAYLGVAMGSIHPPAFIEMHYKPSGKAKKQVAIVGKGVTFDSGGLSLKPPKSMETMKDDMSGAAAVIGLMSVISHLKPQVEVWGYVAAAENMPDAKAQRPGDVVTAMSGKTIEVLNTDAEGRLTLADACYYASKRKPDYMIDLATLTGACLVALGERISAIMGNNDELVEKLIESGKRTGEKMWEMPLAEEYKDELKSPIADLKNVGGPYGGTLNGGLFIQEFVGDTKWAHLDIAGPSWTDKPREYESRGGTGVMVRALADFLAAL